MPFYLHTAQGLLGAAFPWSISAVSSSSSSEAAAQTAWDAGVVALWTSSGLAGLIPTTTTLTETSTSTANAAFKQTTLTKNTHSTAGTGTGSLPYQICEVVTLRTAQATKYGHGRWYLPALAPAALATAGNLLSATAQGDIVTAVNALFTAIGSTLQFQILHRRGTLHGPGALTTDAVTSGDVSNKFAIQRRRGDKLVPTRSTITV
jgi:hypothetical protein